MLGLQVSSSTSGGVTTTKISFTARDVTGKYTLKDGQKFLNGDAAPQAIYRVSLRMKIDETVKAPTVGTAYRNAYTVMVDGQGDTSNPARSESVSDFSGAWVIGSKQGGLLVSKKLSGTAADDVKKDLAYTIDYSVRNVDLSEGRKGSFKVYADGSQTASPYFEQGERVTIDEVIPSGTDAIGWGTPKLFLGDDESTPIDLPYSFDIDGQTGSGHAAIGSLSDLTIKNVADLKPTTGFSVAKALANADGALGLPANYSVHYEYTYGADALGYQKSGRGDITVDPAGTAGNSENDIPVGATVTLSEAKPSDTANITWADPVFAPASAGDVYTITADGRLKPATGDAADHATVTNTVSLRKGTFSVSKKLDGTGTELADADRDYIGTWSYPAKEGVYAAGQGEWSVKASATWTSPQVPARAVVTVHETAPQGVGSATWQTPDDQEVTVGENANVAVTFTNTLDHDPGTVTWQKTDATSGAKLAGSEWSLVGPDGKVTTVVDNGAGDEDPEIGALKVSGLAWGDYALTETKAPTCYLPTTQNLKVSIGQNAVNVTLNAITNQRIPGSLTWQKTDATTGDALAGSEWSLVGPDGKATTVVDNGAGDEDPEIGALKVSGLAWGEYTLTESKAPQGYQLDATAHPVTIDAEHVSIDLGAITNAADPVPPVTNSGDLARTGLTVGGIAAGAALVSAGAALLMTRRRQRAE
ncbi:MSCRAMM family protein [Pseudoclavibacter sp. 13-3]|uniref:MSCRAMM family protein n=1 Tax=Pseudoclavibacter sp. 13-3 TaxID=2901228 RepID=UPI001E44243A|nr:DUF5979 domain-containing protein [Pseudoclavibacter sp. 13-3]MCD7101594.1 DUF5979 domain-containing protein [Pseudoclavibacter sp. 13-3]